MQMIRLSPAQRQTQTTRLLQAVALLRMSNAALAEHLAAEAERNPMLLVARPAPVTSAPFDRSDDSWQPARRPGLHDHVLGQVRLRLSAPADLRLAEGFIEAMEPSGWLGQATEVIAKAQGRSEADGLRMLGLLQELEPAGLFARDLRECLRLQAADRGQLGPVMAQVLDHLDLLAASGPEVLADRLGLPPEEVQRCVAAIRRMDPKPGAAFDDDPAPLREPDLILRPGPAGWTVELNRSNLPTIRIRDPVVPVPDGDRRELGRLRRDARWFRQALDQRCRIILAVGAETARRQEAFLDSGVSRLVPLRIAEVATALALHPSTVSRVVNGLLLGTPRGIVAMRSLFCSALPSAPGRDAASGPALRQRIRELVQAENATDPLTDETIATVLGKDGIPIARRTVAKHRALAGIPPAAARRGPASPTRSLKPTS